MCGFNGCIGDLRGSDGAGSPKAQQSTFPGGEEFLYYLGQR